MESLLLKRGTRSNRINENEETEVTRSNESEEPEVTRSNDK